MFLLLPPGRRPSVRPSVPPSFFLSLPLSLHLPVCQMSWKIISFRICSGRERPLNENKRVIKIEKRAILYVTLHVVLYSKFKYRYVRYVMFSMRETPLRYPLPSFSSSQQFKWSFSFSSLSPFRNNEGIRVRATKEKGFSDAKREKAAPPTKEEEEERENSCRRLVLENRADPRFYKTRQKYTQGGTSMSFERSGGKWALFDFGEKFSRFLLRGK